MIIALLLFLFSLFMPTALGFFLAALLLVITNDGSEWKDERAQVATVVLSGSAMLMCAVGMTSGWEFF